MKRLNYQLFDFLDFDPSLNGEDRLWKADKPSGIKEIDGEIHITIPFYKQQCSKEMAPDESVKPQEYTLRIKAVSSKILRISMDFKPATNIPSPILEMHDSLKEQKLNFKANNQEWLIFDNENTLRAKFDLSDPEIDYWSDLLPSPAGSVVASFFPDGKKEVKLSAYDQFFPARIEAFAFGYVENKDGKNRTTFSIEAEPNESFVGTGERFTKMDLSGQTFQLENQDGQGVNNRRTYKNIPFYISSKMYGMFLHTSTHTKFSLADHSTRSAQMVCDSDNLDFFLIGGDTIEEINYGYRQLTGFPSLPPLWSFGTWMSRMTYFSADEVNEICSRLRSEDYPCDVIHLDTGWFRTDWLCEWKFNAERFPDPKKFISDLRKDGFKVSLWQMPYIATEAEQHDEAKENNYMAPLKAAQEQGGSNFSALDYAGTIDFTSKEATDWYKGLLKELLDMGVVCIKTDFGEDIHMDANYKNMSPEQLHNLYALLYQKAAYEITKEITGDGIIWARAGWAGCQRYPLHWGGDAACSWAGLAGSLKGGLHLGLSGFGFWSHDVPGFHGVPNFMNSVIPNDLYVRWTQFGVFSSHIRYHGTSKREPYEFPEIADTVRKWFKLRYALIPYLLEQSEKVTETGYTILRALIYHHADDHMCWHIHDQYYFGDDFLVAPIMNSKNRRDIYLPEGKWVNFFTGEITEGGKWLKDFECKLEEMPVWVKYGAEITMYPQAVKSTDDIDFNNTIKIGFNDQFSGIGGTAIGEVAGF